MRAYMLICTHICSCTHIYVRAGTLFQKVGKDVLTYLELHGEQGKKWFRQIKNNHDLWEIIADAMYDFMVMAKQPFPNVNCSKKDFWLVQPWKRAMLFLFFSRFVLKMKAQRPWNKFLYEDIKFNKRCIQRYLQIDKKIFDYCDKFNDLPEEYDATNEKAPRKRKLAALLLSDAHSDSPVKRSFEVADTSTDEEVAADDDGDEEVADDGKGAGDGAEEVDDDGDDNGEKTEDE